MASASASVYFSSLFLPPLLSPSSCFGSAPVPCGVVAAGRCLESPAFDVVVVVVVVVLLLPSIASLFLPTFPGCRRTFSHELLVTSRPGHALKKRLSLVAFLMRFDYQSE